MDAHTKRIDTQLIELAGRNWLVNELLRAGIEVARPERDPGVDHIAYVDRDQRARNFVACPIRMKAATKATFSLYPKYAVFPNLILAYVWNVGSPAETVCYALNYTEALRIAEQMGWTNTASWIQGGRNSKPGYSTSKPSQGLRRLLAGYEMNGDKWWRKISQMT